MREIKFRGKRIDNGEWVYGCLTRYSDHMSYIVVDVTENNGTYQVLTETVGQYTGLKDKNSKEIYEGDILQDSYGIGEVAWIQEYCAFIIKSLPSIRYYYLQSDGKLSRTEVIGNIYEHPHLMKGDGNP